MRICQNRNNLPLTHSFFLRYQTKSKEDRRRCELPSTNKRQPIEDIPRASQLLSQVHS
jgi:hypothetical protein